MLIRSVIADKIMISLDECEWNTFQRQFGCAKRRISAQEMPKSDQNGEVENPVAAAKPSFPQGRTGVGRGGVLLALGTWVSCPTFQALGR
jgi:hypothetical protein